MEGEDEIEIGEVDCSVSKPVCTKVDIHSYPTFKLFYDGEEVSKYQGNILISLLFVLMQTLNFSSNTRSSLCVVYEGLMFLFKNEDIANSTL